MASKPTQPSGQETTHSSLPYILPFAIFFALLTLAPQLGTFMGPWEFPFRAVVLTAVLYVFSRNVIDLRVANPLMSIGVGIAVFFIWIGPDVLFPGYRSHWLFQNFLTGELKPGIAPEFQGNWLVLISRSLRAIVLVPIIEELFWRAWLMRWLIRPQFWELPLGAFTWSAMLISAALFGSEHGMFWDVGIAAGLAYNLLMVKTKRLGDCVLAHAVTNGMLSAYVVLFQRWEYWP